jgi:hypothetical protein
VKFLQFKGDDGRRVKRCQFTAIDDATRIDALRMYERHHQESAIDFIDHVVERFPFRIHTPRTDNGHVFHQLLDDTGDVDLRTKLAVWQKFYNLHRLHTGLKGLSPYEALREKLLS